MMNTYKFSEIFSETPGSRKDADDFYFRFLQKWYFECKKQKKGIVINLDGTYGHPASFTDQWVMQFVYNIGFKELMKIKFISNDDHSLLSDIYNSAEYYSKPTPPQAQNDSGVNNK